MSTPRRFVSALRSRVNLLWLIGSSSQSWVVPSYLAASAFPSSDDLSSLSTSPFNIRHVITLTESPYPSAAQAQHPSLRFTHVPADDFHPPSLSQIQLVVRLITEQQDGATLVHCLGGIGRTGTCLAAYLIAFGCSRPPATLEEWTGPAMEAQEAIGEVRRQRPLSVETPSQEAAVREYYDTIARDGRPF